MFHDHALMIHYEKQNQKVHTQICQFVVVYAAEPPTCFSHLLWPSSGRCSLQDTLRRTSVGFTNVKCSVLNKSPYNKTK